jgi:hypothetical protein
VTHAHGQSYGNVRFNDFQMPGGSSDSRLASGIHVVQADGLGRRAYRDSQVNTPKLTNWPIELPIGETFSFVTRPGLQKLGTRPVTTRSAVVLWRIPRRKSDEQNHVKFLSGIGISKPNGFFVLLSSFSKPVWSCFSVALSSTITVSMNGVAPFRNN